MKCTWQNHTKVCLWVFMQQACITSAQQNKTVPKAACKGTMSFSSSEMKELRDVIQFELGILRFATAY
jgi:hypothetical protein